MATTVFSATQTGQYDGGLNAGRTNVQRLDAASMMAGTGNRVRLTLKWSTLAGADFANAITDCFIGQASAGGDPYDFLGTPTRVTFGGANGAAFVSSGTVVSDWVTLPESYDETKSYCVAWNWNAAAPSYASFGLMYQVTAQGYNKPGVAEASTVDKSAYFQDFTLRGVFLIELAQIHQATAAFSGSGAVTARVAQRMRSTASFAAIGGAEAGAARAAQTRFDGVGSMSAHASLVQHFTATLAGAGSLKTLPPPEVLKPEPKFNYTGDRHVRRSGDDYGEAFLSLLPQGQAWPKQQDTALHKVVYGLAQVMGYVDDRAADLLEVETDPRKTDELLVEWETAFGLPDHCIPIPPTSPQLRRNNLVQRMTMIGAQDRQFFIDEAYKVGMVISIREWAPYMCGVSRVGDTRMPSLTDDLDNFRWECGDVDIRFYWSSKLLGLTASYAGVDLFCLLRRWKPAHTVALFDYQNFNSGDFDNFWYSGNIAIL